MASSERGVEDAGLPHYASGHASPDAGPLSGFGTGGSTPSNPFEEGESPHGEHAKTAYYNQASERSLSHVEAKMFYRRHQLETSEQDPESNSPLSISRTFSSTGASDGDLSRTKSKASRRSGYGYSQRDGSKNSAPSSDAANQSPMLDRDGVHWTDDATYHLADHKDGHEAMGFDDDVGESAAATPVHGSDISPELADISLNIKNVLGLRQKYMCLSRQGPRDNPKDGPDWKIYPPPPRPTWDENKNRPITQGAREGRLGDSNGFSLDQEKTPKEQPPRSPDAKRRKAGQNVGEDFDMSELLPLPKADPHLTFELNEHSVHQVFDTSVSQRETPIVRVPDLREYYKDMATIQNVSSDGPSKSFAYRQLDILEGKFHLYFLANSYQETADCKRVPHRDFYNVRKVDTHVHHSACMNQKHLLRFIKSKMKKSPKEVVTFRDGKEMTLEEVFDSINLTAYDLSIDTLDMHAHSDSFHRFDKFNLKYNPIGESRLREIFLKTDNYINGRYLAELSKEVISDLEASKYQFVEWRVSIYGRAIDEWDKLAGWVIDNKLVSHNVRWLIQVPRLYSLYKATGQMENYESIIINLFRPLYEATQDPSSHPKLHTFLQRVIGFDSVDDESKVETRLYRKYPPAKEWNTKQDPPYTYWIYHLFANMTSLNVWRQRRGFSTFVLRPHCGEAGDPDHIAAAVLCCHSISHGLMLRKVPLLQYIFYLDQIGIAMSPLSNNALFLAYDRNPFSKYFKRGLNVSLSTDDPLQIAFTKEPLIEEYSVAAQIYRLSAVDMCELAQHSVIQSGFEHELKKRWLGEFYDREGVKGNDVAKSNVPNTREKFRYDTWREEHAMLTRYATAYSSPSPPTPTPNGTPAWPPPSAKPVPTSHSTTALKSLPTHPSQASTALPRSSSLILPQSPVMNGPRIFPGIVHERTRRGSVRQGSASETDGEGAPSIGGGGTGTVGVGRSGLGKKGGEGRAREREGRNGGMLEEAGEDG